MVLPPDKTTFYNDVSLILTVLIDLIKYCILILLVYSTRVKMRYNSNGIENYTSENCIHE